MEIGKEIETITVIPEPLPDSVEAPEEIPTETPELVPA